MYGMEEKLEDQDQQDVLELLNRAYESIKERDETIK